MSFPSSMRPWFAVRGLFLLVLALAATAVSPHARPAAAAMNWQAIVGGQTKDYAVVALGFFPNELTVDVGDSVTWTFNSDEIHTLTFLGNQPRPSASSACVTADAVTYLGPGVTSYPQAGGGTCPYVNSGVRTEDSPPYTVTFGTAGDFSFVCLVHQHMSGTVHVQPAGSASPHDQRFYSRQGKEELDDVLAEGQQDLQEQRAAARQGPRDVVTLGKDDISTSTPAGQQAYFIPRFLLDRRDVTVGDPVTWTTPDAFTPHTVTFGGLNGAPAPPSPKPVNLSGPGEQTVLQTPYPKLGQGTLVSSGFLGNFAGTQGPTFT